LANPECPRHGVGGPLEADTEWHSVVKDGLRGRVPGKQRASFRCRFRLKDGSSGEHAFRDGLPRRELGLDLNICPVCESPLERTDGMHVLRGYMFPVNEVVRILEKLGSGESYRAASELARQAEDRQANPDDVRRVRRREAVRELAAFDPAKARRMREARPFRTYSREPNLSELVVEVMAEICWRGVAPQAWPEAGIIAVDSVQLYLRGGTRRNRRRREAGASELDEFGFEVAPEIMEAEPEYKMTLTELEDMLDADDDGGVSTKAPVHRDAGVPCWEILGAYGYPRNSLGEFDRTEKTGRPWLLRAYYRPGALEWAHFLRQLPGTPSWVVCDADPDIRVGVELAWPDPATRPRIMNCEWHVVQSLLKRVKGLADLEQAASRLFQTHGRTVRGHYEQCAPNGEPGSIRRLWHFMILRRLLRKHGRGDLLRLMESEAWRRFRQQVVDKDGSLKYSTGAIEATLRRIAGTKIAYRRSRLTNRARTDRLLMLMQMSELGLCQAERLRVEIEHWILHNGQPPRQKALIDKGIRTGEMEPSLRRPLKDEDFTAVGLPTRGQYAAWMDERRKRLAGIAWKRRWRTQPELRAVSNQRRLERYYADTESAKAYFRAWRQAHAASEAQKARERKGALKKNDPEKYRKQHREQERRRLARRKAEREPQNGTSTEEPAT
jgi:hypothetical protein